MKSLFKRSAYRSPYLVEQAEYNPAIDLLVLPSQQSPYLALLQSFEWLHRLMATTSVKSLDRAAAAIIYDILFDIHQSEGKTWNSRKADLIFWSRVRDIPKSLVDFEEIFTIYLTVICMQTDKINFALPPKYRSISSFEKAMLEAKTENMSASKKEEILDIYDLFKKSKNISFNISVMWLALNMHVPLGVIQLKSIDRLAYIEEQLQKHCFDVIRRELTGSIEIWDKFCKAIPKALWSRFSLDSFFDFDTVFKEGLFKLIKDEQIYASQMSEFKKMLAQSGDGFNHHLSELMLALSTNIETRTNWILHGIISDRPSDINLQLVLNSLQDTHFILLKPGRRLLPAPSSSWPASPFSSSELIKEIIGYELIWNNDELSDPASLENCNNAPEIIREGPFKLWEKIGWKIEPAQPERR